MLAKTSSVLRLIAFYNYGLDKECLILFCMHFLLRSCLLTLVKNTSSQGPTDKNDLVTINLGDVLSPSCLHLLCSLHLRTISVLYVTACAV